MADVIITPVTQSVFNVQVTAADSPLNILGTKLLGFTVGANTSLNANDTILQGFGKVQSQINNFSSGISLNTLLADFAVGANTAITAADSILEGFGKAQGQINARVPYTGATANLDLGVHSILAQNATIASSGSGATAAINHTSGTGVALTITKGGNGEGLIVNKTSGSGNAVTVTGDLQATNLIRTGGLATEFLKANGSVDSTAYVSGTLAAGQVAFATAASVVSGDNGLFWNNVNKRLGIGTNAPTVPLDVNGSARILTTAQVGNTSNNGTANHGILTVRGSTDSTIFPVNHSRYARLNLISSNQGGSLNIYTSILESSTLGALNILNTNSSSSGVINISTNRSGTQTSAIFVTGNTGNVLINTTTDAGFRLDVNGTARVQGALKVGAAAATNAAAVLDVESTTKGFLPPRMTSAERDLIATPAAGLLVYNTTDNRLSVYNGTAWVNIDTL